MSERSYKKGLKATSNIHVNMNQLGKVVVLYGGLSTERKRSLLSGQYVLGALQTAGVDAVGIEVTDHQRLIDQLREARPDVVFITLHCGPGGDGRIQALLELMNIPYTGSGVQACSIGMDKLRSKQIFKAAGIPTPDHCKLTVDSESDLEGVIRHLGNDLMVKPSSLGCSIGISRVHSLNELQSALAEALKYDSSVFAEKVIDAAEYTVAILDGEPLPAIKVETDREFFDTNAKVSDNTRYLCPCGLSETAEKTLQKLALQCFEALGCKGYARVDIVADKSDRFYVLEVNVACGLSSDSLMAMAATAQGYNFQDLLLKILQTV